MDYRQIIFTDLQPEQKEILLARLTEAGYEGFEEHDTGLDAFISDKDFDKFILDEIAFKFQFSYAQKKIKETNWNALWESNFQPVIVEDFAGIRAHFHPPITHTKIEIVITPKMSFGTGHHATTYMMIQQMSEIDFNGKTVLDFGTGTGILSILAEKTGAKKIIAIDNDDWSIANASENISGNNCSNIFLQKASDAESQTKFDVILANINKNVILDNLSSMSDQLLKNGTLLLSGLLQTDKQEILNKSADLGLFIIKELIRDNWICLKLSR